MFSNPSEPWTHCTFMVEMGMREANQTLTPGGLVNVHGQDAVIISWETGPDSLGVFKIECESVEHRDKIHNRIFYDLEESQGIKINT